MNGAPQQTTNDGLASILMGEFAEAERDRVEWEDRWLEDLRQSLGQYDPEELSIIEKSRRSRIYFPYTTVKIDTAMSRLNDLLFPASGQKHWDIEPSPKPELDETGIQEAAALMRDEQVGIQEAIKRVAESRGKNMVRHIEDQLVESVEHNRIGYRATIRRVERSALIYGTGVLKGPTIDVTKKFQWTPIVGPDGSMAWEKTQIGTEFVPYFEHVSIWDCYPDQTTSDPALMRYFWQTHMVTSSDLVEMIQRNGFDREKVVRHIVGHPKGDAVMKNHETNLRATKDENMTQAKDADGRYRLYERWGFVSIQDIDAETIASLGLTEEDGVIEVPLNVWILGNQVVKISRPPVPSAPIPYYFWFFEKDESSIWGTGLARRMRPFQQAINSALRAMLDNVAFSAGPQIVVNASALAAGEDPRDIYPFKVWLAESGQSVNDLLSILSVASITGESISLLQYLQNQADEVSIPRFMSGSMQKVQGAGETASGLSMLMGATQVNLKELVKTFDDNIVMPFFLALYEFNMMYSSDPSIKCDMSVKAKGSTVLTQKEVLAEKQVKAAELAASPIFQGMVKVRELLEEIFSSMDLDTSLVRTDEEMQNMMMEQALQASRSNVQAVIEQLEARGVDVRPELQAFLAQQLSAAENQGLALGSAGAE